MAIVEILIEYPKYPNILSVQTHVRRVKKNWGTLELATFLVVQVAVFTRLISTHPAPHVEVIFLKVAHLNNSGTEPGKDRKDRTGRPTRMCTRHATKHEKYFMKCHVPG